MLMGTARGAIAEDKSGYSPFNPTPDGHLRDMTTDRPDTTESPFTIDAGRVQVETTVLGFARSRPDAGGAVSDTYEFATTNVRVGLTERVEVNVVWQPYGAVRTRQRGLATLTDTGIGGLDLRAKLNLWGNDSFDKTRSALALLPYVSLPTDRHNGISPEYVESGLIVPLALKLTEKLGLGLNGGVSWVRSGAASGYHTEYVASASFAYEWTDKLGTYYEVAARFNVDDPCCGDAVVLGTGLTYALAENLQFDAGVNVGVTSATDRINPFVGISRRF
jgi:hypothetical protein